MASVVFNFNHYDSGSSDKLSFLENKQESGFVGSAEIKEDGEVKADPEHLNEEEFYNISGSETDYVMTRKNLKVLEFQFFSEFACVILVFVHLILLQILSEKVVFELFFNGKTFC